MFTARALLNYGCVVLVLLMLIAELNAGIQAEPVKPRVSRELLDRDAWDKQIAESKYPANSSEMELYYKAAIRKAEESGTQSMAMARSLSNLATFYMEVNRLARARPLLDQAIQIAETKDTSKYYLAHLIENRAILAFKAKDYEAADKYSQRALQLYKENSSSGSGKSKRRVAYIYSMWIRSQILLGKKEQKHNTNKNQTLM